MNTKQNELFQYVLETMEGNLLDYLNGYAVKRMYNWAQYCLDGLKHVDEIINNVSDTINRADVKWVVDYLFSGDRTPTGERVGMVAGTEFFESVNATYGVCTDEEVEGLINELLNV